MELDRSKCEMACLHEYLHRTELRMANHRRKWDIATAVSKQRRRWAVPKTEHRRARKSDSDAGRLPSREAMRCVECVLLHCMTLSR